MVLGYDNMNPIQVSISQFYGIEINDFAVTVAKTALWIAESQMMKETESIVLMHLDFLPLKTNAFIHEGNALQVDWESVIPKYQLSYIMGNPPFVARAGRTKAKDSSSKGMLDDTQKTDRLNVFGEDLGNVDYVACWFKKAAVFTKIQQSDVPLLQPIQYVKGNRFTLFGKTFYKTIFISTLHISFSNGILKRVRQQLFMLLLLVFHILKIEKPFCFQVIEL